MRKLYLISCAIVLCMGAIAQEFETIYTSVGNIYKGYISEQIPGKTVAIYATDATLSLGNSDIANFRDEYRRVENLSFIAKEYFKGGEEYVKLCSFEYKGNSIDDALLLKQTSDSLFVRVFTPTTYHLAWKDIVKVEKTISSDIYNDIDKVIEKVSPKKEQKYLIGEKNYYIYKQATDITTKCKALLKLLFCGWIFLRYNKIRNFIQKLKNGIKI